MATKKQVIKAHLIVLRCNFPGCAFNDKGKCLAKDDDYLEYKNCNNIISMKEEPHFKKLLTWTIDDALLNMSSNITLHRILSKIIIEEKTLK